MTVYKSIGVTATRDGLTALQTKWLLEFLEKNRALTLHHGDCIGGDNEIATMFSNHGSYVIAFPGSTVHKRALCKANDLTFPWSDNLVRNRFIVNHVELLLAFPNSVSELQRSGTWFTIRYARKQRIPMFIINPNGEELFS